MPVSTELSRVTTYHEELPSINSQDSLITWSYKITWQIKNISATTMPKATKLGKMVGYHGELLLIK